jgi:hypothetical protein
MIQAGSWVEIEAVLLKPEERAPNLPPDTAKVPYILKVSGFLVGDSDLGQEAAVRTLIGHEYRGVVKIVNPSYAHSFGATVPELLHIGTGGSISGSNCEREQGPMDPAIDGGQF